MVWRGPDSCPRNVPRPVLTSPGAEKEKPAATALFGQLSEQIDAFSGEILAGVAMVVDAPRLFGWAREQIFDIEAHRV